MRQRLKRWINFALRQAGVQLVAAEEDERQSLVDLLHRLEVGNVIDVGANKGQFAQQLLDKGYRGTVHCFEPLETAHAELAARFCGHGQVKVWPRTAIGAEDGSVVLNVSGNSVSSSARPMLPKHQDAAPRSAYVAVEDVPLAKLDSLLADETALFGQGVMLKIDTQGYEAEVLTGAAESIRQCKAVLLEMSAVPLYEGQELWDSLHVRLSRSGFVMWNLIPDFRDARTGQLLQFDGLYVRP